VGLSLNSRLGGRLSLCSKLPRDAFLKDVQVKYDAMAVSQAENIAVQESHVHANQRVAEAKVGGEGLMGHTAC